MRNSELVAWAISGFAVGLVFGICVSDTSDTGLALALGSLLAALFPLFAQMTKSTEAKRTARRKPRSQAQGSFEERIERFSKNIADTDSSPLKTSKMELWAAPDTEEYARTPPKPIGVIRMLLKRIKKALAANKD